MNGRTSLVGALILTTLPLSRCAGEPAAKPPDGAGPANAIERGIFEGVNRRRAEEGLAPLKWNEALAREARRHALNMAGRRFFAHEDPLRGNLRARLTESGIKYRRSSENIFQQRGHDDPVTLVVDGWMRSPGHRRNILDKPMTQTGVGAANQADGTVFYVQIFIQPL